MHVNKQTLEVFSVDCWLIESICTGPGNCGWTEHILFGPPATIPSICRDCMPKEKAWDPSPEQRFSRRVLDRVLMAQVREEDPAFVTDARKRYLTDETARLRADLKDDTKFALSRTWGPDDLEFLRLIYRDKLKLTKGLERELRSLSRPKGTGRARLTEEQMQEAREFPIVNLLDGAKAGDIILCPSHKDKRPSLHVYEDHVHCYGCGFHENAVGWIMFMKKVSFIEAVRDLIS